MVIMVFCTSISVSTPKPWSARTARVRAMAPSKSVAGNILSKVYMESPFWFELLGDDSENSADPGGDRHGQRPPEQHPEGGPPGFCAAGLRTDEAEQSEKDQ
ncbi:hypothetical protein D3C87_1435180 [compost metagenome]